MRFDNPFSVEEWKKYLSSRLSTTEYRAPAEEVKEKHAFVDDLLSLGTLKLDEGLVPLYHMKLNAKTTPRARVSITRAAYDTIKEDLSSGSALFFISYENEPEKYRLSYVKHDYKIKSDPKRYTYLLGEGLPVHTPETRLKPQAFESIEAIEEAFSVEPVNREFYRGIQGFFMELKDQLKKHKEAQDLAIRFIGRLLFCRFLTAKGLIPEGLFKEAAEAKKSYQTILAPLFFQILNKEYGTRSALPQYEKEIPFLNGGLFAPKEGEESLPIGDELVHRLFEFLGKYNFTVDESTPTEVEISIDPEMLGRVFENLLAEINPDTQESARKATGAFYTPREIVDYMVVESLKKYLHNHIKIEEQRLSSLFSTINDHDLSPTELKDTIKALENLKILDPACGSGAFPMGLLQRLFDLRQDLQQALPQEGKPLASSPVPSAYQLKKEILQNCIYGVDIQPIAVEISKLRAFLSIVLEEEKTAPQGKPEAQNLGIQPLPNLEFNFIIANSLVGLEAEMDGTFRGNFLAGVVKQINEIARLFFSADSPAKKIQAQQRFEAFRHNVETADDSYVLGEDKAKLLSFNPFNNSPAEFFEPHIQFGIEPDKNFGIVIGNPPYLQMQSLPQSVKELYQNQLYYSYTRVGDLYQLFYERSLNLLSPNGAAALITSNKWMRAGYGISSRSFFRKHAQIYGLIDLGSGRFESATVDTNILFYGCKGKDTLQPTAPALSYGGELYNLPPLEDKKAFNRITINETDDAWTVLNPAEAKILEKITRAGKPLKDWDISINYGVKTGLNEAFIIDGATKDALIAEDAKSAEIIKPLLRGRDIKRYEVEFADKWLITTFPALKLDIKKFPAVEKYLKSFGKQIEQSGAPGSRKKTSNKWFETQDTIAYYKDFDKPKIVYPDIIQRGSFSIFWDTNKSMFNNTVYMITHDKDKKVELKYIMGIMASAVLTWALPVFCNSLGETGIRLFDAFMKNIPIPIPTPEIEKQVAGLVEEILKAKKMGKPTDAKEIEIDEIVYKLYGLSGEEIGIIEGREGGC